MSSNEPSKPYYGDKMFDKEQIRAQNETKMTTKDHWRDLIHIFNTFQSRE
ncbi:hypothetical protein KB20921_30570 [Edwardsiella ictaluri]|uniref:Uncharacterized protein n=1 Tax=Edwardsiella ictaluri (strain 93-146) TaxID=634503 RepID=C5BBZ6_EDWI9|nr:hypothetical protein NT01EI_3467 [Edwardsiella ictaluri 93-146]BEI00320.1 hypothetical protein KH20906_30470 [Edwardsiella ictaluri]BEI03796.1 hypothetical protein KB20921_30570 [Edwardsiella ictaluri]BEI07252.1 hypothetical protein KH201010_30380 [Edwardsiella ictaluri]BEI10724.1 hypothetical protein STU22726_30550 [Edwardsiella ictaluri]